MKERRGEGGRASELTRGDARVKSKQRGYWIAHFFCGIPRVREGGIDPPLMPPPMKRFSLSASSVEAGPDATVRLHMPLRPWGSFEQWSKVVREAIVFAGLPDPGETRLQLQSMADRDANAMIDIITGLVEMADTRAAVEELCGKLCGRALGYKFQHFARRNFNGRMIDKAGESGRGSNRWTVVSANTARFVLPESSPASPASPDSEPPNAGDEGDVPPQKQTRKHSAETVSDGPATGSKRKWSSNSYRGISGIGEAGAV